MQSRCARYQCVFGVQVKFKMQLPLAQIFESVWNHLTERVLCRVFILYVATIGLTFPLHGGVYMWVWVRALGLAGLQLCPCAGACGRPGRRACGCPCVRAGGQAGGRAGGWACVRAGRGVGVCAGRLACVRAGGEGGGH